MAGTIIRGEEHFFTNLYEGNGKAQRVGNFIPFTDQATLPNSLKFNLADNPKLSRTNSSAGNRRTFTISAWVHRTSMQQNSYIFFAGESGLAQFRVWLDSSDRKLHVQSNQASDGGNKMSISTTRTFEDESRFYHIVIAVDTTQSDNANKIKVYVDGDQITSFSYTDYSGGVNYDTEVNKANSVHYWGEAGHYSNEGVEGYLAQCIFVDGTAYGPETFGITDTSTGRWIPKTLGSITYGTNGARLDFANTAGQTFGDDTSGQGNDFTVTNLTASDLSPHTPTDLYPTLLDFQGSYGGTFTEAGLKLDGSTNAQTSTGRSTLSFDVEDSTGYYFEFRNMGTSSFGSNFNAYGIVGVNADGIAPSSGNLFPNGGHHVTLQEDGNVRINNAGTNLNLGGSTLPKTGNTSTRDTIGCAVKSGKVWFSKNGIWGNANQGNPNSDGTPIASGLTGRFRACALCYDDEHSLQEVNFGQSLSLGGSATSDYSANNGGYFLYPPPTGFRAIKQDNLSETSKGIADIVWIKNRDATDNNQWYDSSRGPLNRLKTNSTDGEDVVYDGLQKFLKGGAAIEDDDELNTSGESYVSWNWVVGGGTTSANTDGVGATVACTIQKNTTAGISIVEWTGGGSAGTIEHGLGQVPAWMMYKRKNADGDGWIIYHHKLNSGSPEDGHISLQTTHTFSNDATMWNDTAPTTQLATIGTYGMQNTEKRVGYFFAEIPGFSKFGDFTGNANSDGPFVYLGFKPKFILFKAQTSAHWAIHDSTRDKNQNNQVLYSSLTNAEGSNSGRGLDFLSNGFKIRQESGYNLNYSGTQTVYFAFAEHPFNGDGSTAFATAV